MLCKKLDEMGVVRKNIHRPRLDFGQYTLVEVLDLKRHAQMLANMLTTSNDQPHG